MMNITHPAVLALEQCDLHHSHCRLQKAGLVMLDRSPLAATEWLLGLRANNIVMTQGFLGARSGLQPPSAPPSDTTGYGKLYPLLIYLHISVLHCILLLLFIYTSLRIEFD